MMNLSKFLVFPKNPRLFSKNLCRKPLNFLASFEEIKKNDMATKNTHLNIDLVNPFCDEETDAKPTEWRRYWNINDCPEVKYNVFFVKNN